MPEIKKCPITKDELRKAFSKDLAQLTAQSSTPQRAYETSVDNLYELFEQAWNRRSSISMETAEELAKALTELRDWYRKNLGLPAVAANAALQKFNAEKGGQG